MSKCASPFVEVDEPLQAQQHVKRVRVLGGGTHS